MSVALQVFHAHDVPAAVLFTAPVGRRTGTGFTLHFLPGFPVGFKTVQQASTSAGFTLCFTPSFTTGCRAAVTFTALVRRRTGTGFTMGFPTGFRQLLVFVVCKCVCPLAIVALPNSLPTW